jgi:DNA-binding XRE family transcriptional regulator
MAFSTKIKSGALRYSYEKYVKDDPERMASVEREMVNAEVAQRLYDFRIEMGLTVEEFAARTDVEPSTVHDLEECDYDGNSLEMFANIAAAFGKIVSLEWKFAESTDASGKTPKFPQVSL